MNSRDAIEIRLATASDAEAICRVAVRTLRQTNARDYSDDVIARLVADFTVGLADYTAFVATDKYLKDNAAIVQSWTDAIYRAQKWMAAASSAEIVNAIRNFFPGINQQALTSAAERYQKLKIWKSTPVIEPQAIDKFENILVHGHVLDDNKRVKFADLVRTEFAVKAK